MHNQILNRTEKIDEQVKKVRTMLVVIPPDCKDHELPGIVIPLSSSSDIGKIRIPFCGFFAVPTALST